VTEEFSIVLFSLGAGCVRRGPRWFERHSLSGVSPRLIFLRLSVRVHEVFVDCFVLWRDVGLPSQAFVDDAVAPIDRVAAVDDDRRRHRVELLVEGGDVLPIGYYQRRVCLRVRTDGIQIVFEPNETVNRHSQYRYERYVSTVTPGRVRTCLSAAGGGSSRLRGVAADNCIAFQIPAPSQR